VDVYYALGNENGALYPGQKLAVTLALKSRARSLVVPTTAVLYDIHGGAWVYQQMEPHVYARRRVAVDYVDGDLAVLATGPEPGSFVVTDGAVELFGTEFGVGH
jgi:multidrug efflux pump subunit AcrA (membrane-fusion protein)